MTEEPDDLDQFDLEQFRAGVRSFCDKEIVPRMNQWEDAGVFDAHELFPKLAAAGYLGLGYPEEDGGEGAPMEYQMVFAEELAKGNTAGVSMAINVQMHMATPSLARFGSPELKEQYLRPALAGQQVAAIAVTEPGAGSDVAGLSTKARRDGDDWVINGGKIFITNGTQADWFCMLVRTSDEGGYRGMSQIIVPSGLAGFTVSRPLDKLGNRSSDTVELHLDEVRVPVSNTIGKIGRGFQQQMQQFVVERLSACFTAVGASEWALAKTREYLGQRELFGAPLAARQYPVFKLTELSAQLELLRSHNEKMCRLSHAGADITREATVGKLVAGRLLRDVADTVLQVHGGMGYMEENWTSRFLRDVRLSSIGGGADEVMLQVLARMDGYPV
ncbi:acyl-CoA dehydrogenase family protein [Auritidibacter ignavus]|uniref:acyl-CoA dehydrogenase family protein n=1 Tax=Auritidibacter ignavus TaxID=678932 RepID=UPI00244C9A4E|nr:acyl-CoA dehydrogenase family protein [Auritidibacter ignavus]WGH84249.1 acyl-CoA dehydrogenase family protein [Auritidibacter ignavus]